MFEPLDEGVVLTVAVLEQGLLPLRQVQGAYDLAYHLLERFLETLCRHLFHALNSAYSDLDEWLSGDGHEEEGEEQLTPHAELSCESLEATGALRTKKSCESCF